VTTPENAASISGSAGRARFERVAPWISTVVRLALGAVLLVAGGLKVIDPQNSVQAVKAYELLSEGLARIVGWGLPFVEIGIGLLLILGLLTRPAAIAAGILMVVFIAAVASAAARGLSIDCGCFGGGGHVAPGQTAYGAEIVRDVGLLLAALWLTWQPRSRYALDHYDEIEENDE
jgi:uncharacterized membrane protein YphA (DoxX/SURF4 family)